MTTFILTALAWMSIPVLSAVIAAHLLAKHPARYWVCIGVELLALLACFGIVI